MDDIRPIPDPTILTTKALEREIQQLHELHEEKFCGVQQQFNDKETALAVALSAQKEAVSKSEHTTDKRFEDMQKRLDDVKDRQTRAEGASMGRSDSSRLIFAVLTILIALAGVLLAFVLRKSM